MIDLCTGTEVAGSTAKWLPRPGLAGLARSLLPLALLVLAAPAMAEDKPGAERVDLTPAQKGAVEAGVAMGLANPGAAKFGPLAAGRLGKKIQVCGWVDGKPYAGVLSDNFFSLFDIGDAVGKSCRSEGILPDPKTGEILQ